MKKKTILWMAMVLLLSLYFGAGVYAGEVASGTCGDNVSWTLDDKGTMIISGNGGIGCYEGEEETERLPYEYHDRVKKVIIQEGITSIPANAFFQYTELKEVSIPNTVCGIGGYAFSETGLTSVEIPGSVQIIDCNAFSDCENLVDVQLSEGLVYIDGAAFQGCGISSITIPSSVQVIADHAFLRCTNLCEVRLSEGLTTIGLYAFWNCPLTVLEIPSTVTYIGEDAFPVSLCELYVAEGSSTFYAEDNVLFSKDKTQLYYCVPTKAGKYVIPDSVKTVDENVFQECELIEELVVPASVEGSINLTGCKGLSRIDWASSVTEIKCKDCESLLSIKIPDGVTAVSEEMFYNCTSLQSVEIPNSTTSIGSRAFANCSSLGSVEIPNSVTSIGSYAFSGCSALKELSIPASVTEFGYHALREEDGITVYAYVGSEAFLYAQRNSIPVVVLGGGCADGCQMKGEVIKEPSENRNGLRRHTCQVCGYVYDETLTMEGYYVGNGMIGDNIYWTLTDEGLLRVTGTGTMIDYHSFPGLAEWNEFSEDIRRIEIESGITSIGKDAFAFCENLESVSLPDTIVSIGAYAFAACGDFSINLPETLVSIGECAFMGARFEELVIPANVDYGVLAFDLCHAKRMVFAEGTKVISCRDVDAQNFVIPASVEKINEYFYSTEYIDSYPSKEINVYYEGSPEQWKLIEGANSVNQKYIFMRYYYVDQIENPCSEHSYRHIVIPSDCTHKGYDVYVCDTCGDSYIDNIASGVGHSYRYDGYINDEVLHTCTVCGIVVDTFKKDEKGSDVTACVLPTCVSDGYYSYVCNICGKHEVVIPLEKDPDAHSFTEYKLNADHRTMTATCDYCSAQDTQSVATTQTGVTGSVVTTVVSGVYSETEVTDTAAVTIDATAKDADTSSTEVTFSKETLKSVSAAEQLTVKTNEVTVTFGDTAIKTIVSANDDVKLSVAQMDADQVSNYIVAEDDLTVAMALDIRLVDGSKKSIFTPDKENSNGTVTVSVPYEAKSDSHVTVYYVDNDGNKYPVDAYVSNGRLYFTTSHFSIYVVTEGSNAIKKFRDVTSGRFYYNPVYWGSANGIVMGMTDTTFEPDTACTRAEVVTFLWRAAGSPEPNIKNCSFKDVKEGTFYYKAMLWAVEQGITDGTSTTTFEPKTVCTRAEVVTFLWRYAGKTASTLPAYIFEDVDRERFYYKAMLWAVEKGITNGDGSATVFNPWGECTRGQVVTFLYRYVRNK